MGDCKRCGEACQKFLGAPAIKSLIEDTDTFIGFLQQCKALDDKLLQRGFTPVFERAAKKVFCPCNRVVKNAEIARQLQKHVIKPILKELNRKV